MQSKQSASKFFVNSIRGRGGVVEGYGVYDEVNGMRSEHARYMVDKKQPSEVCLLLAGKHRDDLNEGIE